MTATAPATEGMDIAGDGNSIPTRRAGQAKEARAIGLDGDVAGVLGQALPHVSSYSVDSDPGPRGMVTTNAAEYDVDPPTRRRIRGVEGGGPRDTSGSEEGYGFRIERDAGSSRAGSNESTDSVSDRRMRRRRGVGGSTNSPRRHSDRSRDSRRRHDNGGINDSLSPRWDRGGIGGGRGDGGTGRVSDMKVEMPPRRGTGGDGVPREIEPSKVLHVRNVGYPVVQSDLVSLLSCFGQVEKVKMFSGQALVQLPSVSIAKATMRHFEEDEEARIGNKRIYINYSRSRSIEGRDSEPLNSTSFGSGSGSNNSNSNSNNSLGGGGGGGGITNGGSNGLAAARAGAGPDGNGHMDAAGPYAHLIIEDHAKLLGLATCYLQNYGIPGGEGAVLNINQREEMADYQRQALAAAMVLNGGTGTAGIATWNGNPTTTAAVASRFATGMSSSGSNTGFNSRPRPGSRSQSDDQMYRPPPRDRGGRGGPSQR